MSLAHVWRTVWRTCQRDRERRGCYGLLFERLRARQRDEMARTAAIQGRGGQVAQTNKDACRQGQARGAERVEEWREAMEAEHAAEVRAEALGTREGETVAEYVARYIEAKAKADSIDRSTANGYRGMLDRQIAPYGEIGARSLRRSPPRLCPLGWASFRNATRPSRFESPSTCCARRCARPWTAT